MMRRILGIAIFILTLLPIIDIGDASSIHAQSLAFEDGAYMLPEIEVEGEQPEEGVKCDCCQETFDDDEAFNRHLKYSNACQIFYGINDDDKDDDKGDGICCLCGKPVGQCTCTGVFVPGHGGGYGGGGSSGGSDPWGIEITPPSDTSPDDEEHHSPGTGGPSFSAPHTCSCLVTLTRKDAVKNLSAATISTKNKKTRFSAAKIADSLKKTIQFPETIRQGIYGTCGAAVIEKELATYHPYLFRECIQSLISTGKYDKWGLELPDDCGIKYMTDSEAAGKGLSVTDVIFQTAFANWAGNNKSGWSIFNSAKKTTFMPKTAGKKDGGTSIIDIEDFMKNNLKLSEPDVFGANYENISRLSDLDCKSYTYIVSTKYNTENFEFANDGDPHFVEITGIDTDGVHFWSWGREFTLKIMYANYYVRRRKTAAVKNDEAERKSLDCKCSNCKDTGCSQCK